MISSTFIQHLLLSFMVGAGFVLAITIIAEKLGSKAGGIVGGLPGTLMISLAFIGIHHGPDFAAESAAIVPAVLGVVCIFLTCFASLPRVKFIPRITISVLCWFSLSYLAVALEFNSMAKGLVILIITAACCFFLMEQVLHIPSAPAVKVLYSRKQLLFRAFCAGFLVMTALYISKVAGPIWGGVASMFPIANFASLIVLQKTAGLDFTRAMSKAAVISASVNTGTYIVIVALTYPIMGVLLGTLTSAACSSLTAIATLHFLRTKVA